MIDAMDSVALIASIADKARLAARGVDLVLLPLPAKIDLAASHSPSPALSQRAATLHRDFMAALAAAGAPVNRVTVYRMLDRFAAAGLLLKQVDAARVTRYALAPQGEEGAAPRFECDDCHRQFRLSQGAAPVQSALQEVLQALASAGHEGLAVDIAVRGRCAGCAHPGAGAAA